MKIFFRALISLFIVLLSIHSSKAQDRLTVIHTNDLHSELMGFSPVIDYTPEKTGDDATIGGWSRIATIIKSVKKSRSNPVLVLDAGDYTMGSLFHTICREEGLELRILKAMGYDAVGVGNHEFDFMPIGFAKMLNAAHKKNEIPMVLLSNAVFSKESGRDDLLEDAFRRNIVRRHAIIEKGNLKIGIFALLGIDAAEVAPFASPVKFADRLETAKEMVEKLRKENKADLVICLSHSGLLNRPGKDPEDVELAKKVSGIDLIISGHSHTKLDRPLIIGGTIIVQSWEYGKRVGILDITLKKGKAAVESYISRSVDDTVAGDAKIQQMINRHVPIIEQKILAPLGFSYGMKIAKTGFDIDFEEKALEYPMGNLIADSIRWYANKYAFDPKDPQTKIVAAVESTGTIRNGLLKGKTGVIAVCDIFKSFPLGIGFTDKDDRIGYPIVTVYVTAEEIKKALEVLTTIAPLKGNSYFLQVSGLKFTYNPYRMLFDRVTGIWLGDEQSGYEKLDYSSSNRKLYRIAANIYNATFLKIIGGFTSGILTIVPKDRHGNPIDDLNSAVIDRDPHTPGIQGLREWAGLIEFMKTFPDTDGDGLPNIPESYRQAQGRIIARASINPIQLLRGGNWLTWGVFGAILIIIAIVVVVVYVVVKKIRKKKKGL